MIKAVIFDIGAVLVEFDWNGFLHRIYDAQTADAVFAATWGTEAWHELDRDALPRETVLGMFTANAPEYAAEIRAALARTNECAKLFPYTPGWIRSLKAQGLSVYFLSNYYPYLVWKNPEVLRFIDDMDGGVFSWQEKITKPDPEIYRRYTGKDSSLMRENLLILLDAVGPDRITVRVPLIPEFNTKEDQARSAELLRSIGFQKTDLFDYVIRSRE